MSDGVALSPTLAAMCADDFVRTIEFIRGTHAAIQDVRLRYPDRPARVLYAGCGPYATLAVPLMAVFSPREVRFALVDVHAESIASARSIVDALEFADFVEECETADATVYRVRLERPPDVLLVEIMQACLEAEPQVAVSRHLLRQAPDAILIPEEVRVDLLLVDVSREFGSERPHPSGRDLRPDRIAAGSAFVVNRAAISSWESISGNRLPGSTLRIPDSVAGRHQPMLFTHIRVYRDHGLEEYDSGLTCPRLCSSPGAIQSGDTIQFRYELGVQPGLRGELGPS